MSKDVSEIRRMLQVYDASASAPSSRQAVGMLEGITKLVATNPDAYDLLEDPSEQSTNRSQCHRASATCSPGPHMLLHCAAAALLALSLAFLCIRTYMSQQVPGLNRSRCTHARASSSAHAQASQMFVQTNACKKRTHGCTPAGDAEAWTSAGGESFCENQEFTGILAARWLEVLSKPGIVGPEGTARPSILFKAVKLTNG